MITFSRALRRLATAVLAAALLPLWISSIASAQTSPATISWGQVLDQEPAWYASADAVRIADNVLLYQHENGGWPKNLDMARVLREADRTEIRAERAAGEAPLEQTTIDNGATVTQMRYLARVAGATGEARFRESLLRGIDYLLEAQYANGGWPQFFPLRDGYYSHVTFNDGAMVGVMRLLREVARGSEPLTFVDAPRRERSAAAVAKGLDVILTTQVEVEGRPTAWCAQYDPEDLSCAQARTYELPSLSGGESVEIVRYLMEIEDPDTEVVRAVENAVRWLEAVKLTGIALVRKEDPSLPRGYDRVVIDDPAAPPLWARFYEIGTNRPMFVGRDGIVRESLAEIEHERRVGYSYLGGWARDLLESEYPAWRRSVAPPASPR